MSLLVEFLHLSAKAGQIRKVKIESGEGCFQVNRSHNETTEWKCTCGHIKIFKSGDKNTN